MTGEELDKHSEPSPEVDDRNSEPPEELEKADRRHIRLVRSSTAKKTAHTCLELYEIYRSYIEHEDDLVNQRLYRLFIAHASLAAAAGVIISKLPDTRFAFGISIVLAVFGGLSIALCFNQLSAINAGLRAIESLNRRWNQIGPEFEDFEHLPVLVGGGDPKNDRVGQTTARSAPIILALFWGVVLIGAVIFTVKDIHDGKMPATSSRLESK